MAPDLDALADALAHQRLGERGDIGNEALRRIGQLSYLPKEIRSNARAKFHSIDPISEYSTSDLKVIADRRMLMEGYEPALTLAKDLLSNQGRSIEDGKKHSNIFLQYTPIIIENGLRSILQYD